MACEPLAATLSGSDGAAYQKDFALSFATWWMYYPTAEKIVLVMDNLNTHPWQLCMRCLSLPRRALDRELELHYTPKHGSWLNMAEIELSVLTRMFR